ncbi:MAG: FHA domain-containing protein [Planctomycetaceae bacterium]|jgi:hypothetical protein|nr:FHA domain-containing protein [Planctomycetaceae bacterium]
MFKICSLFCKSVKSEEAAAYCVSSLGRIGDVTDKWHIICKNGEVIYSDKQLPQKLKSGEVCWIVPMNGITIAIDEDCGGDLRLTQFCIEFDLLDLHNGGFSALIAGKKRITVTEIKNLVQEHWRSLIESDRNQTNLNVALATSGLRCTKLTSKTERNLTLADGAICNFTPYVFLPDSEQTGKWQCWEDCGKISVAKNRFARRNDLEKFLPVDKPAPENIFNVTKIQFGRSSNSNILLQLTDETLSNLFSGLHLTLELTKDGITLTDHSTNGTHYNGQLLKKNTPFLIPTNKRNFLLRFSYLLEMQIETKQFVPIISQLSKQSGLPEEALLQLAKIDKERYELAKCLNIRSISIKHNEKLTIDADTINYYTEKSVSEKINNLTNNPQLNPNFGREFEIVLSEIKIAD